MLIGYRAHVATAPSEILIHDNQPLLRQALSKSKSIQLLNCLLDACVLNAQKWLVSVMSYVYSIGCRFFASRFLRLKNESRSVARKATNQT